jgi:DNA-binding transcriptional LysR family regulator
MNITHLKFLYDAHRFGSVAQAAKINNVAISTISQGIKALAAELNIELTDKKRGQLILTKEAEIIIEKIPHYCCA